MKAAINAEILLDVLGRREPFFAQSREILQRAADGEITCAVTADAVGEIRRALCGHLERGALKETLLRLAALVEVLPVTKAQCKEALESPIADYEEALLAACARKWGADCIVTRSEKNFSRSQVRAISPQDFLAAAARE